MKEKKRIEEIIDDINVDNENISIESNISKLELEKIKVLTLKKIEAKQHEEKNIAIKQLINNLEEIKSKKISLEVRNYKKDNQEYISKPYKKNKWIKRKIISIAASITIILSFVGVLAQNSLSNIYYEMFGENIKYVEDMYTQINKSYSNNGIKLNVLNIIGDENSFYIIFEIEKEDGKSFNDKDYLMFERFHLDLGVQSSNGFVLEPIEGDKGKITYAIKGNASKKIFNKQMSISLKNIEVYNENYVDTNFDMYDFLINNSEYLKQNPEGNNYKKKLLQELKNLKDTNLNNDPNLEEEIVGKTEYEYEIEPKNILSKNKQNIMTFENNFTVNQNNISINNIGFVDGKFSIILHLDSENTEINDIKLVNKFDIDDYKLYEWSRIEEEYIYYTFDVKNMDDIKDYKLNYTISETKEKISGEWSVNFKASHKNLTKKINVNKKIYIDEKEYNIKDIKISPISLNIKINENIIEKIKNPSNYISSEDILVEMKDGTFIESISGGTSNSDGKITLNLIFEKPIDIKNVKSVKIGDIDIEI